MTRSRSSLSLAGGLIVALGINASLYVVGLFWAGGTPTSLHLRVLAVAVAALFSASGRLLVVPVPGLQPRAHPAAIALFAVAGLLATLVATKRAVLLPDGAWDGWMIWNLRARWVLRSSGLGLSPALVTAHADYPLLLSGLVTEGWEILGQVRWWPLAISVLFATLPLALLVGAIRQARGPTLALLAGAVLLSTPIFAWTSVDECADLPLATFVLLAAVAIDVAQRVGGRRRAATFALGGLALSFAAFTKNEGLACLGCFAVAVLATPSGSPLSARARDLLAVALGSLPVLALLAFFKVHYAPVNDLVAMTTAGDLAQRAFSPARWVTLTLLTLRHLFYFQEWGLAWPAALAAITFLFARRLVSVTSRPVWVALLALTLVYLAVLLVTPRDLAWHVKTTLDRLLLQLWPTVLFAIFSGLTSVPQPTSAVAVSSPA